MVPRNPIWNFYKVSGNGWALHKRQLWIPSLVPTYKPSNFNGRMRIIFWIVHCGGAYGICCFTIPGKWLGRSSVVSHTFSSGPVLPNSCPISLTKWNRIYFTIFIKIDGLVLRNERGKTCASFFLINFCFVFFPWFNPFVQDVSSGRYSRIRTQVFL